jgi:hypothetical protein
VHVILNSTRVSLALDSTAHGPWKEEGDCFQAAGSQLGGIDMFGVTF